MPFALHPFAQKIGHTRSFRVRGPHSLPCSWGSAGCPDRGAPVAGIPLPAHSALQPVEAVPAVSQPSATAYELIWQGRELFTTITARYALFHRHKVAPNTTPATPPPHPTRVRRVPTAPQLPRLAARILRNPCIRHSRGPSQRFPPTDSLPASAVPSLAATLLCPSTALTGKYSLR